MWLGSTNVRERMASIINGRCQIILEAVKQTKALSCFSSLKFINSVNTKATDKFRKHQLKVLPPQIILLPNLLALLPAQCTNVPLVHLGLRETNEKPSQREKNLEIRKYKVEKKKSVRIILLLIVIAV